MRDQSRPSQRYRSAASSAGFSFCIPLLALLLATFGLGGCGGATWVDQVTVAEGAAGKQLRGVLVIGLSDNNERRRAFEEQLAQVLGQQGVKTTVGSDVAPNYSQLTRDYIKSILPKLDVDTVLVTKVTAFTSETVESIAVTTAPPEKFAGGFAGNYDRSWGADAAWLGKRIDVANLETSLYDTATENRFMFVRSKSIDLRDIDRAISSLVRLIVDKLDDEGFLRQR